MKAVKKAIAIDFDGCLCTDAFPEIGKPNWVVIERARAEQANGAGLILWTCREGPLLEAAVHTCREWGLTFDAINESLPEWIEAYGNRPRKVGASEYWDDRAVVVASYPHPLDIKAAIHIFERCRLTGEYFTGEAMTGAYVAALAALYEKLDHEDRLD